MWKIVPNTNASITVFPMVRLVPIVGLFPVVGLLEETKEVGKEENFRE
jgi:hypothetical protein